MSRILKSTLSMNNEASNISDAKSANPVSSQNNADHYSKEYFEALYNDNSDPWQYQTRWYEKRKRDMCLAVLPQAKYTNAIELGCGNGVFSQMLAGRCQNLLSIDGNHQAVKLARHHLAEIANVKVIQGIIPKVLSELNQASLQAYSLIENSTTDSLSIDLIVISEILYYLSPTDIDKVIVWIEQNLAVGGTLICCHWRYKIDGFVMTGETVHKRLHQAFYKEKKLAFTHQSQIIDSDFLLDVWQYSAETVAMQESLI